MNFIQRLLGLRRARRDDHEIEQARQQLASMQATIAALAHPTEPMHHSTRKAG